MTQEQLNYSEWARSLSNLALAIALAGLPRGLLADKWQEQAVIKEAAARLRNTVNLIAIARSLGPHGNGHAPAGDPDSNPEYTRGQAELIADVLGLPQERIPDVIDSITTH